MPRVKRGVTARARHKKVLAKAKGFRGREMAHQEFGIRLLERIKKDLEPHSVVESFPRLEGRQMVMLLAPKKVQVQKHHPNKPETGSAPADKVSPAPKPESTAVGSK